MENKFLGSTGLAKFLERLYDVFSKVGHTHDKSEIRDFPTVPTNTSQLTNDSGFITADKDTNYTLTRDGNSIVLTGTDGSTQSVEDLDTIIPVDSELSGDSVNPVQNKVINEAIRELEGKIGDNNPIFVQDEEPDNLEDGVIWIDTDENSIDTSFNIIDPSLSILGAAADSKIVGDALNKKQDVIAGSPGQFVVIGEDGKLTTKTLLDGEEVAF